MAHSMGSKEAAAYILDPMTAPEPFAETGPGAQLGSTFAPAASSSNASHPSAGQSPRTSLSSNNPFRDGAGPHSPSRRGKGDANVSELPVGGGSPRQRFPEYRGEAFGDFDSPRQRSGSAHPSPPAYDEAVAGSGSKHRRRTSSLRARYPGDKSAEPLDTLRRDTAKADRSSHLKKRHQPGADSIDRLDPAIGGIPYHHEGPYDATLLARNTSYKSSPVAALKTSNEEALKATPDERIRDAVERHRPLEGTAAVHSGVPDRLGRVYNYEEGPQLTNGPPAGVGYRDLADREYAGDDRNGEYESMLSLDRKFKGHRIDENGIELQSGTNAKHSRNSIDGANANDTDAPRRSGSLREGLKKRIGSLRHKKHDE